ncbi:MAG: GT4 family glycosyltransferase PelF [Polyangia bacterium]
MISLLKNPCKSASALITRLVRALPDRQPPAQQLADVTLLLEGTYPYVSGGVSSWVHQIIRGLPEIKFSLVFLGGDPRHYGQPKYKLPDNVTELQTHYLMEAGRKLKLRTRPGNAERFRDSRLVHQYFQKPTTALPEGLLPRFLDSIGSKDGIQAEDFLLSEAAWNSICEDYHDRCTDPSFLDYFWTVRMMHAPIFKIADIARRLPPSRIYHSVSTGYAGLLGAFLHFRTGRPFLITEHGIYTKERKIDLAQADWIKDSRTEHQGGLQGGVGYIRQLWIRFFEGIGRLSYQAADPIISLYEGNRKRQIKDGAPPERTQVIPNGIDLDRFAPLRARRAATVPKVLGLIGRVVPIKDIKTFIRAMRGICNRMPEAEGWVIGPTDEDPSYARECEDLVTSLGLKDRVRFLGFQKVEDILPKLGLMLLTSISEAQPLVLLEGFASGLPAVATDVGSCREIIEGASTEDRAFGSAGDVVSIANPDATAEAAVALLSDEARWRSAQEAGIRRVERFYTQRSMLENYRRTYHEAMERQQAPAPSARSAASSQSLHGADSAQSLRSAASSQSLRGTNLSGPRSRPVL